VSSLLDLPARELLARFASSEPTPGGGSAAALSGALGAALVLMVAAMPKTRTGAAEERARLDTAQGWAKQALDRLQRLVDEDSAAYEAVLAAFRLPKADEAERARRSAAIAGALRGATEVPLQTAEACLVALQAAVEVSRHGNPNAISDTRTAGALALAGLLGALENVAVNLRADDPEGDVLRSKAEALGREGRQRAAELQLGLA
jgi:formiminotetrahydrofolate cyclodeaminase